MKHSERFTNAVTKLYNAFHNNELLSTNCSKCAVGNICDNDYSWAWNIRTDVDTISKSPFIRSRLIQGSNSVIEKTGYSTEELAEIELIFITHSLLNAERENKQSQFKGICAVVEYLCELEGIPNVMDYSKLFETENNQPAHKIEEVFQ